MTPIIPGIVASSDGRQPDVPTIGTASAGNANASVPFTAPTYLGKPNDNNIYTATSSPSSITATSTTSPISVTGLSNGTAYTFTVNLRTRDSGSNVIAISTNSGSSNPVTPVAPPPPPPPIIATPPPIIAVTPPIIAVTPPIIAVTPPIIAVTPPIIAVTPPIIACSPCCTPTGGYYCCGSFNIDACYYQYDPCCGTSCPIIQDYGGCG